MVTGAASGIGRATALAFAEAGAAVFLVDRDPAGEAVRDAIVATGRRAAFQATDVSDEAQCRSAVEAAIGTFGRLDAAFNNAGVFGPFGLLADIDHSAWRKVLAVNLDGVIHCTAAQMRAMAVGGGAIVNNASVMGLVGSAGAAVYTASKHGVVGLTRAAAMEGGRPHIRVNAVCPGFVRTPMTDAEATGPGPAIDAAIKKTALRRVGEPEEIAGAVLWLCSSAAAYVTGAVLAVDGGFTAN